MRSRLGSRFFFAVQPRTFPRGAQPLVVGPEFEVGLGDIDLRVGEVAAAVRGHDPADVVDMRVSGNDGVDVVGIDAGLFEIGRQLAHRIGAFHRAHAGLEQRELVAGVDHQDVLVEHHIVGRQEMIAHHLADLFGGRAAEGILRIADRQRPVRHDRRLDAAELETIERGGRCVERRRLGLRHRRAAESAQCGGRRRSGQQTTPR